MTTAARSLGRARRHQRVRKAIAGTAARPRLAIFRSLTHIYAQLIDDRAGHTLVAASSLGSVRPDAAPPSPGKPRSARSEQAKAVGAALAERAKAAGVSEAVFDRGGYRYHGRVKALADAARAGGLHF